MANIVSPRDRHARLEAYYGMGFPDLDSIGDDKEKLAQAFQGWVKAEVERQSGPMGDKRLHFARHRLFRQGRQWISTRDGRQWRELNADENRIRAVFNRVGPALDFRVALLQEQRPGWKYMPVAGSGVKGRETAIAQQSLVEYYFHMQQIWPLAILCASEALTDGVCFLNVFVDKSRGPLLSNVELVAPGDRRYEALAGQGYKVRSNGLVEIPVSPSTDPEKRATSVQRGGDISTCLIHAHETYADPEARCIRGADKQAKWFMVRRLRDLKSVRLQLGDDKLESEVGPSTGELTDLMGYTSQLTRWQRGLPPFPSSRTRMVEGGVYENKIFIAPSVEIPQGMWVELVTDRHVRTGKLPQKVIPIVRVTDGSSDGELYPRPVMSDWIGDQVALNGLGSKILEFARLHSGSRLLTIEGTLVKETFTDIVGSVINYTGLKPDVLDPPRVSPDLWRMWESMERQLEQKTGWNDMARGHMTGEGGFQDIAGRAILSARELFERQFGPLIRAVAQGLTDWSVLMVQYAQYLFDEPRLIPMVGRPDLAKRISSADLDGPCVTYVDPETLQPLPRALRNQLLTDYLDKGLITMAEFKKRAPFAEIRDLQMGDSDHWARAQLINTLLEERYEELFEMDALDLYSVEVGLAIFWQDSHLVHMLALEELILDDKKPVEVRKLAADRWGIYHEMGKAKDFPDEMELQGYVRPVAPAEVMGVPNFMLQREDPLRQQIASGQQGVPGGVMGASPTPEMGASVPNSRTGAPTMPAGVI